MANPRKHIDDFLMDAVADTSIGATGIGWSDFQHKVIRKKRRRAILWISLTILAISSGLGIWMNAGDKIKVESNLMPVSQMEKTTTLDEHNSQTNTTEKVDQIIISPPTVGENSISEGNLNRANKTGAKIGTNPASNIKIKPTIQLEAGGSIDLPNFALSTKWTYAVNWISEFPTYRVVDFVMHNMLELVRTDTLPQTELNPQIVFLKLSVGPSMVNPSVVINALGQNRIHKSYAQIRNAGESGMLGFNMEASIGLDFNRFNTSIGLGFTKLNVIANYNFNYSEAPVLDVDGTILEYRTTIPKQVQFESRQHVSAVAIPFALGINLLNKGNWACKLNQSFATQIIIQTEGRAPNPVFLDNIADLSGGVYKTAMFSYAAGLAVERRIDANSIGFIEPYWSKNFGLNNTLDLYKSEFNSIGVKFGWRKRISF